MAHASVYTLLDWPLHLVHTAPRGHLQWFLVSKGHLFASEVAWGGNFTLVNLQPSNFAQIVEDSGPQVGQVVVSNGQDDQFAVHVDGQLVDSVDFVVVQVTVWKGQWVNRK